MSAIPPDVSLADVGTTSREIQPGSGAQLQMNVTNGMERTITANVIWELDGTDIESASETIAPNTTDVLASRVDWAQLVDEIGLDPGQYSLSGHLLGGGSWDEHRLTWGTITVAPDGTSSGPEPDPEPDPSPGDGSDDEGDDRPAETPSDPPSLLPAGFPTLPALGPLSAEQTTAGALAALALLVVVKS
ncbi:hypothetical protein GOC74_02075 [Halomicrobium mukohataei]|uniref:Uncharacterized protein n=1 Tax=Halomicrobium mukohataei TaxID=57705 RepID=A0A847U601_9EURY|nr:hypothetical protein [Halomicrobium mukohataei]NLV08725.1 hypothetical protein [Halomicrobium mukohataei]